MSIKRTGKLSKPTTCKANDHNFIGVETTPSRLIDIAERTFKLFCSKCGTVKTL